VNAPLDFLSRREVNAIASMLSILGFGVSVGTIDDRTFQIVAASAGAFCFGVLVALALRGGVGSDGRSGIVYQLFIAGLLPALQDASTKRPTKDILGQVVLSGARDVIERELDAGAGVNVVAVVWQPLPSAGQEWGIVASDGLTAAEQSMQLPAAGDLTSLISSTQPVILALDVDDALKHAGPGTREDLRVLQATGYNGIILVPIADRTGRVAVFSLMSRQAGLLDDPEVECAIGLGAMISALWTLKPP